MLLVCYSNAHTTERLLKNTVEGDAGMSSSTYFIQECPTCGRALQVRVQYLGKLVKCRHCQGDFEACDPTSAAYPPALSGIDLLRRADQLLDSVDTRESRRA